MSKSDTNQIKTNKQTHKKRKCKGFFLFIYLFDYLIIMITISIIFLARVTIPCWFVEWCQFEAIYFPKSILSDKHLNIFGISSSVHKLMPIHSAAHIFVMLTCCLAIVVWSTDGSTASSDFYPILRTPIHKHVQVRHQHAWGIQVVSSSYWSTMTWIGMFIYIVFVSELTNAI